MTGKTASNEPYIFTGRVLPERAQLSLNVSLSFEHGTTKKSAQIVLKIILNQVLATVYCSDEWNIFDLRNVVRSIIQNELAKLAFLKGDAYELEITRVIQYQADIDYVFGIDVKCIEERNKNEDFPARLASLRELGTGNLGVYINRAMNDLSLAMKHADDTAFYCYRAIETLRQHCAERNEITSKPDARQWEVFRQFSGVKKDDILAIKRKADPLRHGKHLGVSGKEREVLFNQTWDIVENYLNALLAKSS